MNSAKCCTLPASELLRILNYELLVILCLLTYNNETNLTKFEVCKLLNGCDF